MQYTNFDKTAAYRQMADYAAHFGFNFKTDLDAERVQQCQAPMAARVQTPTKPQ
jgi:hypothetical protein